MAWAVAYSATILALAYAVPRGLAIWAQLKLMHAQLESITQTDSSGGQTQIDWDAVLGDGEGGGYV